MIYQELRKIPTDILCFVTVRKRLLQKPKHLSRFFPIDVTLLKESELITAVELFDKLEDFFMGSRFLASKLITWEG